MFFQSDKVFFKKKNIYYFLYYIIIFLNLYLLRVLMLVFVVYIKGVYIFAKKKC